MADSANSQLEDWSNTSAINILRVGAGFRGDAIKELEKLEKSLVAQVANLPDSSKKNHLNQLLKDTQASIGSAYQTISENHGKNLEKLAGVQIKGTQAALNGAIGVPILRKTPTETQINAVMQNAVVDGHPSAKWWAAQDQNLRFKFQGQMREGFLRGESVPELVKRIRGTKDNNYKDGLMNIPKHQATALVRTSVQSISNHARLQTIEENADLMKGVKWVATLDVRTSNICKALDGLMWSVPDYEPIGHEKKFPGVTAHWQCRSTQSPVMKSLAELAGKPIKSLDDETFAKAVDDQLKKKGVSAEKRAKIKTRQRASMDGQVPETRTYDSWLRGKPPEFQVKVLGAQRAALFADGKLTTKQLTNHDNRPLTVEQLEAAIDSTGSEIAVETEGQAQQEPQKSIAEIAAEQQQLNAAAKAEIDDTLANPKGKTLLAKSIKQLQKQNPELTSSQLLEQAKGMAAEKQAAASKASKLSTAKKKILNQKKPSPSEQATIDGLSAQELENFYAGIEDAKKAKAADEAYQIEKKALQEKVQTLKHGTPAQQAALKEFLADNPGSIPTELDTVLNLHLEMDDLVEHKSIEELASHVVPGGANVTKLKQNAFKQLTGVDPQKIDGTNFHPLSLADEIPDDKFGVGEYHELNEKVKTIAAEKQAAASKASKLSTAKKKLAAGKKPSPSEQATIDALEPEELTNWKQQVDDAKAAATSKTEGIKVVPPASKLDTKKGLAALKKAEQIEGSEYEVFVDFLPQEELDKTIVTPLKIKDYDETWEKGEDFSTKTDAEKEKTANKVVKIKIDDLVTTQPWVEKPFVEKYLKSGELESVNPAHKGKPPMVVKVDGEYQLHDGNHRVSAWKLAGEKEIEVMLYDLDGDVVTTDPKKAAGKTATQPDIDAKNLDLYVPQDISKLKTIKTLPGSTNLLLMEDPSTGKQWVVKTPDNGGGGAKHLQSESTADELYRIMGARVPGSTVVKSGGKTYKVAEFIPDAETLGSFERKNPKQAAKLHQQAKDHFVMDALTGNWDVAGQSNDNMLVHNGKLIRVDNGGALGFRAQGTTKTAAQWSPEVTELKTLRDPSTAAGKTADIFKDVTDEDINSQIRDIVGKRDELISAVRKTQPKSVADVFEKRIDWLEQQLPAEDKTVSLESQRQARTAAVASVNDPQAAAKAAKKSRINGTALNIGSADIEDMQALVWEEKDTDGKPITVMTFKVTDAGAAKVRKALPDDLPRSKATTGATSTTHPEDNDYKGKFVAMVKTTAHHDKDKSYNKQTVDAFYDAYVKIGNDLKAEKAKAKPDKALVAMLEHYEEQGAKLDKLYEDSVEGEMGAVPKIPTEPWFYDRKKYKQQTGKPKAATGDITGSVSNQIAFRETKIENGRAKATGGVAHQLAGTKADVFDLKLQNGTELQVMDRLAGAKRRTGLALEGTVTVRVPGAVDADTIIRATESLEKIGIDTKPATAKDREWVWLAKTTNLNTDTNLQAWKKIEGIADVDERVKEARKWMEKRYKTKIPKPGQSGYTADGQANSFGEGTRHVFRADLTPEQVESNPDLRDLRMVHGTSGAIHDVLDAMLQSGGETTPTIDRMRKGVNVGATGGMSSSPDITTGGASYFFTRIRHKASPQKGLYFKARNLARADAVTYTGDKYGAIESLSSRRSKPDEYSAIAQNKGSDETIFKRGLFLLDELDRIHAHSESNRQQIIDVFHKNGVTHLSDGRKVEDIITF